MQIDVRRTAAVLVGLAMVAGIAYFLVSDSGAEPQPPPPENGPTESPTPTESLAPTPEPPPELNNTGNDFEAIWRSMNDFRDWIYSSDPDVRWLDDLFERSCACFKAEQRIIRTLNKRGWRYDDRGVEVLSVELVERPTANLVTLEVTDQHNEQILVDLDGEIVRRGSGWDPRSRIVGLHRDSNGRWRVDSVLNLDNE